MKYFFLTFLLFFSLPALAQQASIEDSFIGVSAGSNTYQMDVGLGIFQSNFTTYGLYISGESKNPSTSQWDVVWTKDQSKWNTSNTIVESANSVSFGPYACVGRAIISAGISLITEKDRTIRIDSSGYLGTMGYQNMQKTGGYIKVGFRARRLLLSATYNSYYGGMAGVGFVF